MSEVRTRFAPSPSGHLHIGGARTALFNYLFARHTGGCFILRIEDTDRARSTEEAIAAITDSLRWLALDWDEGPYFQSQRGEFYREHADRLLTEGKAYRCYCTPEELEAKRKKAEAAGGKFSYDGTCRERTDPQAGRPFVVRFRAPRVGTTVVDDMIRGKVLFDNGEFDDLVILRSNGVPTYNFSAVVDDALMRVTHIIRGEDHLTNTPKQIQMYAALGYPTPSFAHVPLIHGLDGKRLSKRHGATSVGAYREMGYLPHALVNYLVRLGWSCGDQEIFSLEELIEKFTLENVGRAAGVFNPEKLEWVNFQHLKKLSLSELAQTVKPLLAERGWPVPEDAWLEKMVATLQERAKTLVELLERAEFCLREDIEIDPKAAEKHLAHADPRPLRELRDQLADLADWNAASIQQAFDQVMTRHGLKLGKLAQPVRVALTGVTASPGIFEVADLLGRRRTLKRLEQALETAEAGVWDVE
jgi:glutamyl-tRNA synthetase